jgi:hypothetical protein
LPHWNAGNVKRVKHPSKFFKCGTDVIDDGKGSAAAARKVFLRAEVF